MSQNALERLFNNNNNDSHREYTLEEQMASAEETDDFLNSMSTESKDALMNKIQEVTMDEPDDVTYSEPTPEQSYTAPIQPEPMTTTPVTPTPVQQVESVSEPEEKKEKPTRGRPKKHTGAPVEHSNNPIEDTLFVPIMDQLAKDLIDDLIKNDYKISRFTTEQMKIVYDYMYNKF